MYSEAIERSQRFKLALRMGIPIIMLTAVMLFSLLSQYLDFIPPAFITIIVGLLAVAVYFQFYLIYQAFDEGITDPITHTFTRDYLKRQFIRREGTQTLILFRIENIDDINERLGFRNGDRVLYKVAQSIDNYFQDHGIEKPTVAHFKGGDFIILLEGSLTKHKSLFDLLCTKMSDLLLLGVEIHVGGAIIDTYTIGGFEQLIERLYELRHEGVLQTVSVMDDRTNLSELEQEVLFAINRRKLSIKAQCDKNGSLFELSIKLLDSKNGLIHQKRYLPIVARMGLMERFTLMELDGALEYCIEYPNYRFALNISTQLLRQKQFFEELKAKLSLKTVHNLLLIIEEREYYASVQRFNEMLQRYRNLGIKIVLDGLGSNQTTLEYLRQLDVDLIRFDSKTAKHLTEPKSNTVVMGLTQAARSMGVATWIGMIENEAAYEAAKGCKTEILSGRYFATIAPIEGLIGEMV